MPDREKVIKGLECCTIPGNCGTCPWYPSDKAEEGCIRTLMKATLELLKAQEPVEPIRMNHDENKYRDHYKCPICDDDLTYEQQYCAECGRAVKWE